MSIYGHLAVGLWLVSGFCATYAIVYLDVVLEDKRRIKWGHIVGCCIGSLAGPIMLIFTAMFLGHALFDGHLKSSWWNKPVWKRKGE